MLPVLFIPTLKSKERRRLHEHLRRTRDALFAERLRAVLWSEQGKSVSNIARLLAKHNSTVQRWLHDYRRFGWRGLEVRQSPGRPRSIDADGEQCLSAALASNPRDLGYRFTRWSAATLGGHLYRETHTRVSEATILRAIKRLRYRYKRPKLSLRHRQNRSEVKRARRARDAAPKKPGAPRIVSSFSSKMNASSISIPSSAGCGD